MSLSVYHLGWQPKCDILKQNIEPIQVRSNFLCTGTSLIRHNAVPRDVLSGKHEVIATLSEPTKKMISKEYVATFTPFGCSKDWHIISEQCESCYVSDRKFDSDYKRMKSQPYREKSSRNAKINRKKRKLESETVLKTLDEGTSPCKQVKPLYIVSPSKTDIAESKEEDLVKMDNETLVTIDPAMELKNLKEKLKKLKLDQLKDVCRKNHLMVSGTKDEVLLKILKCKLHDGAGPCPRCGYSKLKFEYPDNDIMSYPIRINCRHMKKMNLNCPFSLELKKDYATNILTSKYSRPLADTYDKILAKFNILV